ncbi:MAG: cytochrome P450 [Acidimicrobiia bacterium]
MRSHRADRPSVSIDLTDPDLWQRGIPHEELARLRRDAPVAWAEHPRGQRGFWVVTRHADVVAVSRDPTTYTSRDGVITLDDLDDDQLEARRTMLEEDPPRHRELRSLTSAHFTPRAVRAYEEFVRHLAAKVIDEAIAAKEVDFVEAISELVPIRVLGRILGVADDDVGHLIRLGNQMIGSDDPEYTDPMLKEMDPDDLRLLPFGHPAALEAFEIATAIASRRRVEPRQDVMSALALGEIDGHPLTERELGTYFVLLVIAGNETTRHTITLGVKALAEHPEQWERLRSGTGDANRAADEVIRWASAIHFHRRTATQDTQLAGIDIAAGEKVALYFASANFDETVFDDPYRFDLARSPNDHVSFGRGGPHFCLGAHLARLEVAVVLEELAKRISSIALLGEAVRLRSNHINGIKHLPVRLNPI